MIKPAADLIYGNLVKKVLEEGEAVTTRNSDVLRLITCQAEFTSTPLVSVRKTAWKNALREWEWFMSGSNNLSRLHPSVHDWWKPWADQQGYINSNYSVQFRHSSGCYNNLSLNGKGFDQIAYLIDGVKNHPNSRRNVITTWNTADMAHSNCSLTNCHSSLVQAFVDKNNRLTLWTCQRSVDVIVGLTANWIQSWAFLVWLAHRTGREVGKLIWSGGDVHVYKDHLSLAARIVDIKEMFGDYQTPGLVYTPTSEEFLADDFSLSSEYKPVILERAKMIV